MTRVRLVAQFLEPQGNPDPSGLRDLALKALQMAVDGALGNPEQLGDSSSDWSAGDRSSIAFRSRPAAQAAYARSSAEPGSSAVATAQAPGPRRRAAGPALRTWPPARPTGPHAHQLADRIASGSGSDHYGCFTAGGSKRAAMTMNRPFVRVHRGCAVIPSRNMDWQKTNRRTPPGDYRPEVAA